MRKNGKATQRGRSPAALLRSLKIVPRTLRLYWRLLRDPRVSTRLKLLVALACLYLASPIDLIPDYSVPVLGHLDDGAVLFFALRHFLNASPPEVVDEHTAALGLGEGD